MSVNTTIRFSAPIHMLAAFGLGAAAAAACGAAFAWLMAARGLGPGSAGPFATAAVCVGSLLGLAYALVLLGVQLACGGIPDAAQLVRLGLVLLSGAAGGSAGALGAGKKRRH